MPVECVNATSVKCACIVHALSQHGKQIPLYSNITEHGTLDKLAASLSTSRFHEALRLTKAGLSD